MSAYPVYVSYCTASHPHHFMLLKTWLKSESSKYQISGSGDIPHKVISSEQQPLTDWLFGNLSATKLCVILVGKGKCSQVLEKEKSVARHLNVP